MTNSDCLKRSQFINGLERSQLLDNPSFGFRPETIKIIVAKSQKLQFQNPQKSVLESAETTILGSSESVV